jgi:hypothetical protein
VKRVIPGLTARDYASFLSFFLKYIQQSRGDPNAPPTTPTPTQTCPNANPEATGDFLFCGTSIPKKGGAAWGGGAQQQQQKSAAAAAAAAAHQGKRNKYC